MSFSSGQPSIRDARSPHISEMLKALGGSLPDPLYLLDNKGDIVAMNDAAETLNESLEINQALPEAIRPCVEEELTADEDQAGSHHGNGHHAKPFICPVDGREKTFLPRVVKIEKWEGDQIGAAVLLSDITELRLREGIERDLVSAVSHEIRTPLTSIQMAIYILLERNVGNLNPTQEQLLETARFECQRLLETLNTLLAMVRSAEEGGEEGADALPDSANPPTDGDSSNPAS